jgi:hypothetical protein
VLVAFPDGATVTVVLVEHGTVTYTVDWATAVAVVTAGAE